MPDGARRGRFAPPHRCATANSLGGVLDGLARRRAAPGWHKIGGRKRILRGLFRERFGHRRFAGNAAVGERAGLLAAPAPRSRHHKASWRRPGPCSRVRSPPASRPCRHRAGGCRTAAGPRPWPRPPKLPSDAPTSLAGARCEEPLGNRISTRPSQNAMRNRKNMKPVSPATDIAARGGKLAGSIESGVRSDGSFLPIIEQNKPQIFEQLEKI